MLRLFRWIALQNFAHQGNRGEGDDTDFEKIWVEIWYQLLEQQALLLMPTLRRRKAVPLRSD